MSWQDHLALSRTFAIEVSGQSPGLTHSLFATQRAKDAVVDTLRERLGGRPSVDTSAPDVRIVLHLHAGKVDVSLDLAGESLHRRGYRQASHPAALKETLAAVVVLASGYAGDDPFLDPLCGSGTIAIEAALLAEGRAPNADRNFGAERWPAFDDHSRHWLGELRKDVRARRHVARWPVVASDHDPEAVATARRNAKAAGVKVEVREADARTVSRSEGAGHLVSNPPYGGHVGGGGGKKQLKSFYHALGDHYRGFAGYTLAFLAGAPEFESAFGSKPKTRKPLFNGPLRCELLIYKV